LGLSSLGFEDDRRSEFGRHSEFPVRLVAETAEQPQEIDPRQNPMPPPPEAARDEAPQPQQPKTRIRIPIDDPSLVDRVKIRRNNDKISLTVREAPLNAVLALLAEQHQLNVVAGDQVNQSVSVTLSNVSLGEALDAITLVNGYTWVLRNNVILVSEVTQKKSSPLVQGQTVQVFPLNYVLASDVEKVVKGLLSPVGLSFPNLSSPSDQRKTKEQIVVQDMPAFVERVAEYIRQVDQPPQQVLVEAHVLQVVLKGDYSHGVDFQQLVRVAGAQVEFGTVGFADPHAATASFLKVSGGDLDALIQCLMTTTDAKTLASPKVAVVNNQEAKIQIGSKLGYKTLQTTQTSTLENVQFLDTGVILKVTPTIALDGQILLNVKPEVSDGLIDPKTGLPNSNTTMVETKVILADGEAILIGGLIQEKDTETMDKVPLLGDIKYLGYFFQRRKLSRERTEIIITLLPRVVPCAPGLRQANSVEVARAATPLLTGDLYRVDRTLWEAEIPCGWPLRRQCVGAGVPEVVAPQVMDSPPTAHPSPHVLPRPADVPPGWPQRVPSVSRGVPEPVAPEVMNSPPTAHPSPRLLPRSSEQPWPGLNSPPAFAPQR
jgi:type II secretory pathway component GspD/PulD (secretin)